MWVALYAKSHSFAVYKPVPKYFIISLGATIASPSKAMPGVATCTHCFIKRKISCACGKFWQVVPICFQINAGASIRKISTPIFA